MKNPGPIEARKCFRCEKKNLKAAISDVPGEVRGEKYTVQVEAMVCPGCGFQVLTDEQSAAYTIAIADAYRKTHGLLTTRELKTARSRLGMSQRAFAKFLRVGEASVKRWEAGLIQDEAYDQLIRLRTDLEAARENVVILERQMGLRGSNVWTGEVPLPRMQPTRFIWSGTSANSKEIEIASAFLPPDLCARA